MKINLSFIYSQIVLIKMRPPAALSVMIKLSPWDLLQVLSLWFQWKTSYRCVCITTRDIWRLITRLSAKIHWHIFKDLTCIQSNALKKVEAKKKSQNTVLSRIKVQSLFNSWTRKHSLTFLTGELRKRCALHLISFDKIPDLLFSLCLPQKRCAWTKRLIFWNLWGRHLGQQQSHAHQFT